MGADNPCEELARGALEAASEFGVDITLVGDKSRLEPVVSASPASGRASIVDVPEFITMEDDYMSVRNTKSGCSMVRAMKLLAAGEGDAAVTAGSTGAAITAATLYVKRVAGVRRAALAPILPLGEKGIVLIDCGANVDCTPEYLLQFGLMGSCYAKYALGIASPRVALLNNGVEPTKGGALQREAYALLSAAGKAGAISFTGNIEGRDVPFGKADVVVTDGFSGNVLLKSMEGLAAYMMSQLKSVMTADISAKLAALALKGKLTDLKERMNYKEIGGSPFVGVSAPVYKAHGSSDAFSIRSAIKQAICYANAGIPGRIAEGIGELNKN